MPIYMSDDMLAWAGKPPNFMSKKKEMLDKWCHMAPAAWCQRLQSLDLKLKGYALQVVRA